MKVAFIGLGSMGSEMARNLLKSGHELTVYNRTRSRAEPFAALGPKIATTPGEAAKNCDAVLTMLADDAATEAVVFGSDGILESMTRNGVHASMSTISVALSRRLMAAHRERQQHYLGSPVFGRPEAAANDKLVIVAACAADQIHRCQPLFDAM
jgi:3-hydroxyisobutyrate dehydrogenase-like beta-hydroxyacid dehydrogenase